MENEGAARSAELNHALCAYHNSQFSIFNSPFNSAGEYRRYSRAEFPHASYRGPAVRRSALPDGCAPPSAYSFCASMPDRKPICRPISTSGNALYGFARVDEVGALHRACRAVNAVTQCGFILAAYLLARFLLCVDDGGCRFYQLVGQLCGRRTESNLIGHLIESADRLRAFAVGAANGTAAAAA